MNTDCPDCGTPVIHDPTTEESVQRMAWVNHRRYCRMSRPTPPQRRTVMTEPTPVNRRPSARELAEHDDKRIARQAEKVIAEEKKLTELWKADAGKAELRAEIARLEAELKAKKDALRSGGVPKVDTAAVRAWAAANGVEVKPTGMLPKDVITAYRQATGVA